MKIDPAFVDKHGAHAYSARSIRAIDYARAAGDLPFYKCGRKIVFRLNDLDKWMDRFRVDMSEVQERGIVR
jgi:hypothetical protein